ncbi:MAG: hypothetical protein F6K47_36515 [Symploca sp. SIO2E6]|nr:hypothetical protein [Symploca sp. SIO2E6]
MDNWQDANSTENSLLCDNYTVEQASSLWQSHSSSDVAYWQDASSTENSWLWNNLQWNRLRACGNLSQIVMLLTGRMPVPRRIVC